jgi:hypothetical protein
MRKQIRFQEQVDVQRSEYYPPEAEVAEGAIGIVAMRAEWLDVTPCIHTDHQVTIGARGCDNDGDWLSYELDLTPGGARRLAELLVMAADAASAFETRARPGVGPRPRSRWADGPDGERRGRDKTRSTVMLAPRQQGS